MAIGRTHVQEFQAPDAHIRMISPKKREMIQAAASAEALRFPSCLVKLCGIFVGTDSGRGRLAKKDQFGLECRSTKLRETKPWVTFASHRFLGGRPMATLRFSK